MYYIANCSLRGLGEREISMRFLQNCCSVMAYKTHLDGDATSMGDLIVLNACVAATRKWGTLLTKVPFTCKNRVGGPFHTLGLEQRRHDLGGVEKFMKCFDPCQMLGTHNL